MKLFLKDSCSTRIALSEFAFTFFYTIKEGSGSLFFLYILTYDLFFCCKNIVTDFKTVIWNTNEPIILIGRIKFKS